MNSSTQKSDSPILVHGLYYIAHMIVGTCSDIIWLVSLTPVMSVEPILYSIIIITLNVIHHWHTLLLCMTKSMTLCTCVCVCMCIHVHCKCLGGQTPPFCLRYHTNNNCPFGMPWETKWWALSSFVFILRVFEKGKGLEMEFVSCLLRGGYDCALLFGQRPPTSP